MQKELYIQYEDLYIMLDRIEADHCCKQFPLC